ncbi:MAG TPA: hypothetical protein VJ806_14310 [Luteimonas sp.]|nr:hypothetical protein [Luteimonas sp.]
MTTPTARWFFAIGAAAAAVAVFAWLARPWLSPHEFGVVTGVASGALAVAALSALTGDFSDTAPATLRRRYYRAIALPIAAFLLLSFFRDRLLDLAQAPWLRIVIALLPMLPASALLLIVIRYVLALDDLQRRIESESFALATLLVILGYMAMSLLKHAEVIAVPADLALKWVFPLICGGYIAARLLIQRRYR